jgi:IS5 family transposase
VSHRSIGQEGLSFAPASRSSSTLDRLSDLIDWIAVAFLLEPLYPASKGEPAWPPLAMFKALLLAVWHDLSDVKLAEALEDRASFRRFCGFSSNEPTPERTAFVRFRQAVIAHGMDRVLFERVTADLKARAITVKTGTLVDATIIASASETDEDGRWVKHKGRAAVHGFKAHVGADASTALVEQVAVTPANPTTVAPDRMLCLRILARCLPTAPIEARISAMRFAPPRSRRDRRVARPLQ